MDLQKYFDSRIQLINESIDELLPCEDAEPKQLHAAMRYSIFAGGKRIRPILFIAACEALQKPWEKLLPYACALEMIHTYSLIHDDLPCMDNDDLRRGRPTCHIKFGEATALLAGDALLTHAFTLFSKIQAEPQNVLQALTLLSEASGCAGMVGGQLLDLEAEGTIVSPEKMQLIHAKKTGALITASIVGAAILTNAHEKEKSALQNFSKYLGIAFQIVDDILDVVGDEEQLGKPVGSDERNHKSTYPLLFGIEESRQMAKSVTDQALNELAIFGDSAEVLREIAKFILHRNH